MRRFFVVPLLVLAVLPFVSQPALASAPEDLLAREIEILVGRERAARGLAPLTYDTGPSARAAEAARRNIANDCGSCHDHGVARPEGTGEIVVWVGRYAGGTGAALEAWMQSPPHRRVLLDPSPHSFTVGVSCTADGLEAVAWFWDVGTTTSKPYWPRATRAHEGGTCDDPYSNVVAIAPPRFLLTRRRAEGPATIGVRRGPDGATALVCDWDGDGSDEPVLVAGGLWWLYPDFDPGPAVMLLPYGRGGDEPFCGDWNGHGADTPGVRRGSLVLLRTRLAAGPADISFVYGRPDDRLVIGDWDGDGRDGIGVHRGADFHLRDGQSDGPAEQVIRYGRAGDTPIAGDWDGDGRDEVSIRRGPHFHLSDEPWTGVADAVFPFGRDGDRPVIGDWDGDGADDPGVVR